MLGGGLTTSLDEPDHGRVKRVGQMGISVHWSIYGQGVLGQVVGANAKNHLRSQYIGQDRRRGFQSYFKVGGVGDARGRKSALGGPTGLKLAV